MRRIHPIRFVLRLIRWIGWVVWYFCFGWLYPRTLGAYVLRVQRTRYPWRKFEPSVYHNDTGKMWHVYLTDAMSYTTREEITLDIYRSQETHEIVGFKINDEQLRST